MNLSENQAFLPQMPEVVNSYTFKTTFPPAEILAFGSRLGFNQQKISDDHVILYNTTEEKIEASLSSIGKLEYIFFSHLVNTGQNLKAYS